MTNQHTLPVSVSIRLCVMSLVVSSPRVWWWSCHSRQSVSFASDKIRFGNRVCLCGSHVFWYRYRIGDYGRISVCISCEETHKKWYLLL